VLDRFGQVQVFNLTIGQTLATSRRICRISEFNQRIGAAVSFPPAFQPPEWGNVHFAIRHVVMIFASSCAETPFSTYPQALL
jgi:hypothetical protein